MISRSESVKTERLNNSFWEACQGEIRKNHPLTTDVERPDDPGGATWIATDAELADDIGMLYQESKEIGCHSFPLSAFSFVDSRHGRGNTQVRSGIGHEQIR